MRLMFVLIMISALSSTALADVVGERKAAFKANNEAIRTIAAMLGAGNKSAIIENATIIADWADRMPGYFPKGSDSRGASPAIWTDFDGFKAKAAANAEAARAIVSLAQTDQMDTIGPALQALGNSCKSCHSSFKN